MNEATTTAERLTRTAIPTSSTLGAGSFSTSVSAWRQRLHAHRIVLDQALTLLAAEPETLAMAGLLLIDALRRGRRVLIAGNGGSAAAAQHIAGELVGRFKRERAAYAAIALTTDSAILTAIGNDYGFEQIFARQVAALGQPGDILLALSTSGQSANVISAAEMARAHEMPVIAITAGSPSRLQRLADVMIQVPVGDTATAQELHLIAGHLLCEIVEAELSESPGELVAESPSREGAVAP